MQEKGGGEEMKQVSRRMWGSRVKDKEVEGVGKGRWGKRWGEWE